MLITTLARDDLAALTPEIPLLGAGVGLDSYGLLCALIWPLAAGRTLNDACLSHIGAVPAMARPPILVTTPAHQRRLTAPPRQALRGVFSSGGPLPAAAAAAAVRHLGRPIQEIYGSTETGGIASRCAGEASCNPLPGASWRLQGDRLAVRSDFLPGRRPFLTACCTTPGPKPETFILSDHADRVVKVEEQQVALDQVEIHLGHLRGVTAVRVLPLPCKPLALAAVVAVDANIWRRCLAQGEPFFIKNLRCQVADLAPAARPRRWRI